MNKCYECGKELSFWESYHHLALGKKELICSECYDVLEENMEEYRDYLLNYPKKDDKININKHLSLKTKIL